MPKATTISARYAQLETQRQTYLERGRASAALTIPSLMPPQHSAQSIPLPAPYQSLGARGVNNLASKLLLSLLPPNSPFFRLTVDDFVLQKLVQESGKRADVEEALNSVERSVMGEIETSGMRAPLFEGIKQFLVTGNVLLFLPPDGGIRVFRLDRFVVKRDPMGNVLEVITQETLSPMELTDAVRDVVIAQDTAGDKKSSADDTVTLYTRVSKGKDEWKVTQEISGVEITTSAGSYPLDKSPWIPLRFTALDNEDYGRGLVEEYLGDIKSLEGLTRAIVEGSAAAAKVLFMVAPNSTTKKETLAKAENGAIVQGNAADVSTLQLNKFNDFRVALETINGLTERLSYAFLLNSSIQRNGDRVTAEEIRYMARELEDTLGGVYSALAQELQLPLVKRVMFRMERQGRLPKLPEGAIKPTITTGVEAIGRGNDLSKLDAFLKGVSPLGPEAIATYLNVPDYIKRVGTSLGIDIKGLVRTEEEVAAQQQQAQEQQQLAELANRAAPNLVNAIASQQQQQ